MDKNIEKLEIENSFIIKFSKYHNSILLNKFLKLKSKKKKLFEELEDELYSVYFWIRDKKNKELLFVSKKSEVALLDIANDIYTVKARNGYKNLKSFLETISSDKYKDYTLEFFLIPKGLKECNFEVSHYFCNLINKYERQINNNTFSTFVNFLLKTTSYTKIVIGFNIIIASYIAFSVLRLSSYGMRINTIDFQLLSISFLETIFSLTSFPILTIIIVSIVFPFFIKPIGYLITKNWECNQKIENITKMYMATLFIISIFFTILSSTIEIFNYYRSTMGMIKEKIYSNNIIIDMTTKQYIFYSTVPSISKVIIKNKGMTEDKEMSEFILYMGSDENFFYYFPHSLIYGIIDKELKWKEKDICKGSNLLYPMKVIKLLKSTNLKTKKTQKINKKNMIFIDDYNDFNVFCKKSKLKRTGEVK